MVAVIQTLPDFQLGDIVEGRYQILRKLADGGMGTVYLAEHVLIRRRLALKLLHAELASDSAMVRRFMNEASAAGTLGHPHIVESTDMGFTRYGIPYIVFEYLEGTLLIEEIYRLGGLPIRRALHIASQIASALDAAHNARIVHLDLKSDNVFLIDRGESVDHVKVLDFGISRFLEAELDGAPRGQLAGTPEFMAPEQVTMPDLVDGRADIYALGVLLYEMLCARCPHANRDRRMLLHQIVDDPPEPLDRAVPIELERLLFDRLLVKSRDHRIQTMSEVKAALDEIATSMRAGTCDSLFAFEEPGAPGDPDRATIAEADVDAFAEPCGDAVRDALLATVAPPAVVPVPVPALAPATMRAPVVARHGPRSWWLIAAVLSGATAAALWLVGQDLVSALDRLGHPMPGRSDATIGATLAVEQRSAEERVSSLANDPRVRAAIEGNAASTSGLLDDGPLGDVRSGEAVELVRTAGSPRVLLRTPPSSRPLVTDAAASRFAVDGARLRVIASAPVHRRDGGAAGVLAIATPIDLAPIEHRLGERAATAALIAVARDASGGLAAALLAFYALGWLAYGLRQIRTWGARPRS